MTIPVTPRSKMHGDLRQILELAGQADDQMHFLLADLISEEKCENYSGRTMEVFGIVSEYLQDGRYWLQLLDDHIGLDETLAAIEGGAA